MRLDRFLRSATGQGRGWVRAAIAQGRVALSGAPVKDGSQRIDRFQCVTLDEETLQQRTPRYVLLHKPAGVVSATTDPEHQTVVDLIDEPWAHELHLAGRLDRFTTGLVVLTNDSRFSEALTAPEHKVPKRYIVTLDQSVSADVIRELETGIYFAKEGITTQPATVAPLSSRSCRLTIFEGKHHQVKRMFAQFGVRVTALHRESMGCYTVNGIPEGEFREADPALLPLSPQEEKSSEEA